MSTVNNGESLFLVQYSFTRVVQRIFNCDKIQDDILTLDKVLNSLIDGSPFCVIIYKSYKLSQMCGFIGPPCIYWTSTASTAICQCIYRVADGCHGADDADRLAPAAVVLESGLSTPQHVSTILPNCHELHLIQVESEMMGLQQQSLLIHFAARRDHGRAQDFFEGLE